MISNYDLLMVGASNFILWGIITGVLTVVFAFFCVISNKRGIEWAEGISLLVSFGSALSCGMCITGVICIDQDSLDKLHSDISEIVAEDVTLDEKKEEINDYLKRAAIAGEVNSFDITADLYEVKTAGGTYKFMLDEEE